MKKLIEKVRESKGFISIEVIMIAGIIIVIGAVVMYAFTNNANTISNTAVNQLQDANDSMTP